jgi:hypothetical protein
VWNNELSLLNRSLPLSVGFFMQMLLSRKFSELCSSMQEKIGLHASPNHAKSCLRDHLNQVLSASREELEGNRAALQLLPYIVDIVEVSTGILSAAKARLEFKPASGMMTAYGPEAVRRMLGVILTAVGFGIGLLGPGLLMALAGTLLLVMELPNSSWFGWLRSILPEVLRAARQPSGITASIEVDGPLMVGAIGNSLAEADKLLASLRNEPAIAPERPLEIDNAVMGALQSLFGAFDIENGRYSEKTVQALAIILAVRGLEFISYRKENHDDFDAFFNKSITCSQTLRPAVLLNGKIALRGAVDLP